MDQHRRVVRRTVVGWGLTTSVVVAALALAGCTASGSAGPAPSATTTPGASAASSAAPSPSVSTLSSAEASQLGATPGSQITILPSPSETAPVSATPSSSAEAQVEQAAAKLEQQVTTDAKLPAATDGAADYSGYVVRTNTAQGFSVETPVEWTSAGSLDRSLVVGTQPGSDYTYPNTVFSKVDTESDYQFNITKLRATNARNCTGVGEIRPYADGRFTGTVQSYTGCQGTGNDTLIAVQSVAGTPAYFFLDATLLDQRDSAALAHALASLTVIA